MFLLEILKSRTCVGVGLTKNNTCYLLTYLKNIFTKFTLIWKVRQMNEKRFPYCKFTIEEEKQIIKEYENGNSLTKVGRQFGCDPSTVKNILKAYNIQTRNLSQARRQFLGYTINENAFNVDTPDSAYWLGVMYSDGYISKTNNYTNYFGLTISEKDTEWLNKFKEFLQYSGNVNHFISDTTFKKGTKIARLLVGNNKIVEDLERLGVVEHKTFKLNKLPSIKYLDDFIRGYIDGDGALTKRTPRLIISGTKEFLTAIANYFGLSYSLYQDKNIYSLQYRAKETTYLEKRLYKNANYYLDRKFQIASRSFNSPITL